MNRLRIPAIILIVLIVASFVGLLVSLILPNYVLVGIFGTALIVEFLAGFAIKVARKRLTEEKEEEEK